MKLRLGKICNSFRNCSFNSLMPKLCCFWRCNSSKGSSSSTKNMTIKKEARLIYYTFFYNHHNDSLTALETFLYPFVDAMTSFLKILGYCLVILVWVLLSNMIFVFYAIILPNIYDQTNTYLFSIHFLLGNWLAVNTCFHYWMGTNTNPGEPPKELMDNVTTMCKKCVAPKPPRTHHCSVCGKCILKMDHHCPWFNNCIGFYNHRYFYLFCVYLVIDCTYLTTIGFYYYQMVVYPYQDLNIISTIMRKTELNSQFRDHDLFFTLTTAEFFVCFVAGIAIFCLAALNTFIISHGSTNIEIRSLRIPCLPQTYSNPRSVYDAGFVNNWKIFLGASDLKTFFTRVICPSSHKPIGNGIDWSEYFNHARAYFNSETHIV